MHTSEIVLNIELDENKIPEKIHWTAQDGGIDNQETKTLMLALWDEAKKETLRIDLWTKDMPVDSMKIFFHQCFMSMADAYFKATQDDKMQATIKDFAAYFAEKTEILPK